ncbi:hypothetical protein C8A01DRAFT_12212 [Parachaetomium inaequale]|uniref:RING-type domain-containing protein n=1 Tax=Parachaetomium inaequale TaxID=2588326 RepID=A0AAN6SWA5_9PEZI|nr:hypothetical protein C8A01DRAFT_12212 [Parachaetomium inaequale]
MCIKLTRHFWCAPTVEHVCQYLIRCSNPTFMPEDLAGEEVAGRQRRPCLEEGNLETHEEWYRQACPSCTGEMDTPRVTCVQVGSITIPGPSEDARLEEYFSNADSVDDTDVVSVYVQNLAYWLFSYFDSEEASYGDDGPSGMMRVEELAAAQDERRTCVLNELVCQVHPEHGSPLRMVPGEEAQAMGGEMGFNLQSPDDGCGCLSTESPWLRNWALHVRRTVSTQVYVQMVEPDDDGVNQGRLDLAIDYDREQRTFRQCAALQKAAADKGPSALEALPVLEMLHRPKEVVDQRAQILEQDARSLILRCREDVMYLGGDRQEFERHEARASLLPWASFILTHDSGLSTGRAREILALFAARVVRYDPEWQEFEPRIWGYDAGQRLAQLANRYPAGVSVWAAETLELVRDAAAFEDEFNTRYADWEGEDRERVALVHRNLVVASQAQLEELRRSGDAVCPICLEHFDDHSSAASKRPVQNRRCHQGGHAHWCGSACLVRFARTLYGDAIEPRCPICRTNFEDPAATAA